MDSGISGSLTEDHLSKGNGEPNVKVLYSNHTVGQAVCVEWQSVTSAPSGDKPSALIPCIGFVLTDVL